MPQYLVSVDKVEKETGLDFLSALNLAEQKRIESSKAIGLWK
jgi:DNA/RNA endonuclease G (NUC1)